MIFKYKGKSTDKDMIKVYMFCGHDGDEYGEDTEVTISTSGTSAGSYIQKSTKEEIDFSLETNLYTKKTGIWGDFNIPDKQRIQPIKFKGKNGDYYSPVHWYSGGKSDKTKELRSNTPLGFSKAFFTFNK